MKTLAITHQNVIPNLYDVFHLWNTKMRCLAECSGCSFSYNESEMLLLFLFFLGLGGFSVDAVTQLLLDAKSILLH